MNSKLRLLTGISLFLSLGVATGCPGDDSTAEGTEGATSSTGDASTGPGMTSMPMTSTPMTSDDSGTSSSGPTTISASGTEGMTDTGPVCDDLELGAACVDPVCDCASDNCFVVGPLGGVCSECDESADCKPVPGFGCNPGNPLTGVPAVCSRTGEVGEGCETIDDCAPGRFCPIVIEVPGIVSVASCSECEGDMGCAGGRICAPSYDIAALRGYYACADPGSVPDAEGCNLDGDGSECASGECAPAALDGITFVAVCSPCNGPGDCGGGLACQLPEVMLDGAGLSIVPGACV